MEEFFKKISSSLTRIFPVVKADDLDETSDPQVHLRHQCQNGECAKWYDKLEECNERVTSRTKTAESCHEEMIDFVNCLDHCVSKDLFSKLK
ncbi:ubiquinol-cytochrome c reductase complex 11 kDa protein, putative [Pediculus humanus corporis]|uniref:Ubiquinol-cytochrome c reductase complex 11 kDa protein, putative n=1 Tax=Pediculus humanus subsp. corporis TaxID=121224 RepID=E0VJ93_PEDHC|nr:ubiquinol-cytochrome c reductase complex 11 kDa protein, putative [Pediculus humanus corporis]EEB13449.1 ubiquinol-cytochrome c reductase complex 11 kDa protein, putative [Pediculus humanus corporis]